MSSALYPKMMNCVCLFSNFLSWLSVDRSYQMVSNFNLSIAFFSFPLSHCVTSPLNSIRYPRFRFPRHFPRSFISASIIHKTILAQIRYKTCLYLANICCLIQSLTRWCLPPHSYPESRSSPLSTSVDIAAWHSVPSRCSK